MKVIITAPDLPIPIGTIMDVGDEPPAAWHGRCRPYIEDDIDFSGYAETPDDEVGESIIRGLKDAEAYMDGEREGFVVHEPKPRSRKRG